MTYQAISKWEWGGSHPDITFLPALANMFETTINLLVGTDEIRAEATRYGIHKKAVDHQRKGDCDLAEESYRDASLTHPNKPDITLTISIDEKQKNLCVQPYTFYI